MDIDISRFIDEEGRVCFWPAKRSRKLALLVYLKTKIEPGKIFTEKEINEELMKWSTIGDHVMLRRELVDLGHLERDKYGSAYFRRTSDVSEDI